MDLTLFVFVVEPWPGCPSYKGFVGLPLDIDGSCYETCAANTIVNYLCDEFSSTSSGTATCTLDYTWDHSPSLEACTPTGE